MAYGESSGHPRQIHPDRPTPHPESLTKTIIEVIHAQRREDFDH